MKIVDFSEPAPAGGTYHFRDSQQKNDLSENKDPKNLNRISEILFDSVQGDGYNSSLCPTLKGPKGSTLFDKDKVGPTLEADLSLK